MITLRQLRYLSALARHGHFGRAAEDCGISQPALSMQIRELEQSLGAPLVERRPNEAAACCQAKLMFWSFSGTERIRLPVAAK